MTAAGGGVGPDRWYHLAGTYDPERVTVFVNGVSTGVLEGAFVPGTLDSSLYIGASFYGVGLGAHFTGQIDDVRIYESAVPLAEHALLMILHFSKNLHVNRTAPWQRAMNAELAGQTLGLIGFGASARELARRAAALGMRIIAIDAAAVPKAELEALQVDSCGDPSPLNHVLAAADFVSVHVPLTEQTHHLIDRGAIARMKPTAVPINVARGAIVEEEALIEALRSRRIKGAALDVYAQEPLDPAHPLLQLDNVLTTPHVAGFTDGTWRRRSEAAAENVVRIAEGRSPLNLVTAVE